MPTLVPVWVMTIRKMVNIVSLFGVWLPLILGIWRWRSLSKQARIVVVYFAFWAVEAFVDLWIKQNSGDNRFLYHITVFVETWLLGWAYYSSMRVEKLKRWFLPVGIIFSVVAVADAFIWSGLKQLNDYARSAQTVVLLSCCLLYFEQCVREARIQNPWWDFMFLTSVGQTVYYAGSVMSYLVMENVTSYGSLDGIITSLVVDSTYIFAMVLMTLGLWRDGKGHLIQQHGGATARRSAVSN